MFASKEMCREMAAPKVSSWSRLKKFVRYILEHPRGEWRFPTCPLEEALVLKAPTGQGAGFHGSLQVVASLS
jgi:hypothetical protein